MEQKFCAMCGVELLQDMSQFTAETAATVESGDEPVKGPILQATEKVNQMIGEKGAVEVNLKDVFSDVFKSHSKEEGELLFISGTKTTTPDEADISTSWPKPWFFSRVFTVFALTFLFLFICTDFFENMYMFPGMIIVGSFAVPFSLLILFWEMNARAILVFMKWRTCCLSVGRLRSLRRLFYIQFFRFMI